MKIGILALALGLLPFVALAGTPPSSFEQAAWEKARADVLLELSDQDLAAYCITMKFGGSLLPELRNEMFKAEGNLAALKQGGIQENHPKIRAALGALETSRSQYAAELASIRKALEIQRSIAQAAQAEMKKPPKPF